MSDPIPPQAETANGRAGEPAQKRLRNYCSLIVPDEIERALLRRRGQYTDMRDVFHCILVNTGHWVGVAGDGANGSYEHFSYRAGVLKCSDCGYGETAVALRDVLMEEVI